MCEAERGICVRPAVSEGLLEGVRTARVREVGGGGLGREGRGRGTKLEDGQTCSRLRGEREM